METAPLRTFMAIEQWGFFNVSHPLRHGPTVNNGHLRGPVTLTPVAERLAVELSLPVFTTKVCCDQGSNPDLPQTRRTLDLYATAAVCHLLAYIWFCDINISVPICEIIIYFLSLNKNLILASATAQMFYAWKIFLHTYAYSSGQLIPFIGMSPINSTNTVWYSSNLMELNLYIPHRCCFNRKADVVKGNIKYLTNLIKNK